LFLTTVLKGKTQHRYGEAAVGCSTKQLGRLSRTYLLKETLRGENYERTKRIFPLSVDGNMVLGLKGLKSAKNMIFKNVLDLEKFSLP
jgi:hypothetical protein